jgi:hypothetical protein
VVEELSKYSEAYDVNQGGVLRSENADISSDSPDKNSGCRKSKVSPAMSIIRGSVESKSSTVWYLTMYKSLIIDYF